MDGGLVRGLPPHQISVSFPFPFTKHGLDLWLVFYNCIPYKNWNSLLQQFLIPFNQLLLLVHLCPGAQILYFCCHSLYPALYLSSTIAMSMYFLCTWSDGARTHDGSLHRHGSWLMRIFHFLLVIIIAATPCGLMRSSFYIIYKRKEKSKREKTKELGHANGTADSGKRISSCSRK